LSSITKSAFDNAAEFILENARPIEVAQFDYHFRAGSIDAVLAELKKFQNEDGGFGHGMEPDVRMPMSSPFSSTLAFQVLWELGVAGDDPIVRSGLAYLEQTYDRSIGGWEPNDSRVDDYPHAPWWDYVPFDGVLDADRRSNPGAEIAGYFHLYSDQVDDRLSNEVTEMALCLFDEHPDDMEVHAMMCFARMAEMAPPEIAEQMLPKLKRGVKLVTTGNPEVWQNYGGRPLWFAPRPDNLLSEHLSDSVQVQLDFEIATQSEDGSWKPIWSYGDREADMSQASVEWAGWLTLRNLLAFNAWGRI
jgi:hypothetical protein